MDVRVMRLAPDGKYKTEYNYWSNVPSTITSGDPVDGNYFCTESTVESFLSQIKDTWELEQNLYYGK
jgi:hypothetical protein